MVRSRSCVNFINTLYCTQRGCGGLQWSQVYPTFFHGSACLMLRWYKVLQACHQCCSMKIPVAQSTKRHRSSFTYMVQRVRPSLHMYADIEYQRVPFCMLAGKLVNCQRETDSQVKMVVVYFNLCLSPCSAMCREAMYDV